MKKEKTKEKTMVQQGTYIPTEVAKFLKQKSEERYPRIAPARLASEIIVQWAIENGMEKPKET